MFAGVDKTMLILECTLVGALVMWMGAVWASAVVALLWFLIVHPVLRWVNSKDPLMTMLYVRSLRAQDFYPAQATVRAKAPKVKTSVPLGVSAVG